MATEILMPALSPTMEEGKLAKWLVKEGQKVRSGDIIAEIETDKATMEVEAVDEGTVGSILIAEGTDKVKVNTPIAVLLEEGESASAAPKAAAPQPAAPRACRCRAPSREALQAAPAASRSATAPAAPAPAAAKPAANGHAGERIFASPLARRLAAEAKVDLARVAGSGPHGRIVQRDIEAAAKSGTAKAGAPAPSTAMTTAAAAPAPAMAAPMANSKVLALYEEGSYEVLPHDGMRRIIAERLTQSKQTIPHFYLNLDCRLDQLLAARSRINAAAPKEGPRAYKLSVNDFVIKALALGAPARAGRQRDVDRCGDAAPPPFRCRRRGGGRRRPVHAGDPARGAEDARRDLQRDEGSRGTGPQAPPRAARVPGRHHVDLEPRHVRDYVV